MTANRWKLSAFIAGAALWLALLAIVASLVMPGRVSAATWSTKYMHKRAAVTSGISGQVVEWPNEWPCDFFKPCSTPVQATFNVWHAGVRVATVTTAPDGRFRVALVAGRYTLRHNSISKDGGVESLVVDVPAGRYVEVEFVISSGLI